MTAQPSPYQMLELMRDQHRITGQMIDMMAGLLDRSTPDPFLDGPLDPGEVRTVPCPSTSRRVATEARRTPVLISVGGVDVSTTDRRARLLTLLLDEPQTIDALKAAGISPNNNSVHAQIFDTNRDLERAGCPLSIRALPRIPKASQRGSNPALYALQPVAERDPRPHHPPTSQSEGVAGERPEEAASDSASGQAVEETAQDAEFVTQPGGEVATIATESPPGADDEISPVEAPETAGSAAQLSGNAAETSPVVTIPEVEDVERSAGAQPHSAVGKPSILSESEDEGTGQGHVSPPGELATPAKPSAGVSQGSVAAVDVRTHAVFGPKGQTFVNTRAARILDCLKNGDLLGVEHLAKKARVTAAADCRHAIRIESDNLLSIGLEVWTDKLNMRLREAA